MLKIKLCALLMILAAKPLVAQDSDAGNYIRLVNALDEPEFYCIDLAGWGANILLDDPLQTHTCKTRNADDEMFSFEEQRIRASKYDRCIQVAGSSGTTLPGSAVLAKTCSDSALQKMSLKEDGKIQIVATDYCLGAGSDSREASGPSHMWRTLTVVNCETTAPELVTWQIGL